MEKNEEPKVFYVEDDEALAFLTKDALEDRGYDVYHYSDGIEALKAFTKGNYDLCVLDIMLPRMDGFQIAKKIRSKNKHIPILFLSAKSLEEDKLTGFNIGADDYIVKPFSVEELYMKIEVFLRRNKITVENKESQFVFGIFFFDYKQFRLYWEGKEADLTEKEADLLRFFLMNQDIILKRSDILIEIWGRDDYFLGRSLDVFISRLRKYLKPDKRINLENIHSVGFRLNMPK